MNKPGFSLCHSSPVISGTYFKKFQEWIKAGFHGEMAYLARPDTITKRRDPQAILPGAKSVISLGFSYEVDLTHNPRPEQGKIAWFARYRDYHKVIPTHVESFIQQSSPSLQGSEKYVFTDSAPILERSFAVQAGLGWIGKNSNLISREYGSFIFLAEILSTDFFGYNEELLPDRCGACTRCIDACPSGCINADRTIDAKKCLSYLTIEKKGLIPAALRPLLGNTVFGCDVCQSVCPWNQKIKKTAVLPEFQIEEALPYPNLVHELYLNEKDFAIKYFDYGIYRLKRERWLRNISIACGNMGNYDAIPALIRLLQEDNSYIIRAHSAWALGLLNQKEARLALNQSRKIETNEIVKQEIVAALIAAG